VYNIVIIIHQVVLIQGKEEMLLPASVDIAELESKIRVSKAKYENQPFDYDQRRSLVLFYAPRVKRELKI